MNTWASVKTLFENLEVWFAGLDAVFKFLGVLGPVTIWFWAQRTSIKRWWNGRAERWQEQAKSILNELWIEHGISNKRRLYDLEMATVLFSHAGDRLGMAWALFRTAQHVFLAHGDDRDDALALRLAKHAVQLAEAVGNSLFAADIYAFARDAFINPISQRNLSEAHKFNAKAQELYRENGLYMQADELNGFVERATMPSYGIPSPGQAHSLPVAIQPNEGTKKGAVNFPRRYFGTLGIPRR